MRPTLRDLKAVDYANISIFGFGLAALSTSLGQIILPMRVLDVAPESLKNTYLGTLSFAGMIVAMLVQPAVGYLSDRTTLRWGRRRPYIALGTTMATLLMAGIGLVNSYPWLVAMAVLLQLSTNIAQNPYDAIVRDRVPQRQRGKASSVRAITAAAGAILFTLVAGLLMDHHRSGERDLWLWLTLGLPSALILATMLLTLILVKENDPQVAGDRDRRRNSTGTDTAHPQLAWILAAGFFFMLGGGILQTYTLYFLRDVVELENPASGVGILAIVVGATILITLYPAGLLADRIGRRPLLILSAISGSTGSLLYFWAQNLEHVVLIGVLLGIAVGIFMSAGKALLTDMVSSNKAALQLGLANFILVGGLAIAKLSGIGIDRLNSMGEHLGYYTFLGVCAASFFLGAILIAAIRISPMPAQLDSPEATPTTEPVA